MQFIYLNTKRQLLKRVLDLQEELNDYKRYYEHFRDGYKRVSKEIFDQNDYIKHLECSLEHEKNAADGYKKAYNELKEKETKEVNFTINQINAGVWKAIKAKTFPEETHKCTKECFVDHVMPAVQRDYDSINPKYKEDIETINAFLKHWGLRLKETYSFVNYLFVNFDGEVKAIFKI